ncbi:Fe-S oxidoreductase [Desulfosarcina widdelii]|uniref:Fe-S oxidoreductase n=2 Tax=Desulfosarcina widdelii TaxID=947919 RepID=A0A5K7ZM08_9BACT|nr:Fe-S oxidoreductase [Desulfosarcina widdelii]
MSPDLPGSVYFFGTCLMDAVYPDAGMAAIRLLQSLGANVIFPPDQSCCGQPAYNSGFIEEARAVARKQIQVFSQPYPIVVPSGSCAGMMKHHYPALFAGREEEAAAHRFAGRVYELFEYLVTVLNATFEDRGDPVTVTWHSSCHALREMKVVQYAKDLIGQLKNVTLVELARETECCGFGGTFAVKQPAISAAMVKDKVADIRQTGASTLLAGDCGCLMNITGAMDHEGVAIDGKHLAEFIWERTNGR